MQLTYNKIPLGPQSLLWPKYDHLYRGCLGWIGRIRNSQIAIVDELDILTGCLCIGSLGPDLLTRAGEKRLMVDVALDKKGRLRIGVAGLAET